MVFIADERRMTAYKTIDGDGDCIGHRNEEHQRNENNLFVVNTYDCISRIPDVFNAEIGEQYAKQLATVVAHVHFWRIPVPYKKCR